MWALRCRKNRKMETEKGNYRSLDYSTLSTSLMLFFLLVVLIISSIWGNGGSKGERVNINGTSVVLYSDEVPISMETIGVDPKGAYRTQKKEERTIRSFSFNSFELEIVRRESFPFINNLPETVEISTDSTPKSLDRPLSSIADSPKISFSTILHTKE